MQTKQPRLNPSTTLEQVLGISQPKEIEREVIDGPEFENNGNVNESVLAWRMFDNFNEWTKDDKKTIEIK